ncbi:MAG: PilN domain-containing protein [Deltaproteobacteria bacterium]|nr:PilN domain-containing protein [Deltaproteobacteria bacterium]
MIRINLLPFRAARKSENIRRQVSLFLLSLIFVILVMGYYQIILKSKISEIGDKINSTKQDLTKYQKKAKDVDEIKKTLENLEQRTNVMKKLDKNRREPVELLDAMTQLLVPNRMWLSSLKSSGKTVRLTGTALDNKTTADFMKRLEKSDIFSSVVLHALKHQMAGKQRMKSFTITCTRALPKKPGTGKVKK